MATPDTTLQIWGMGHLAGATVYVALAGVSMGSFVVASDGSVTVTYGSDTSGKITAQYLVTNFGPGTTAVGSRQDQTFGVYDGTSVKSVTVPVLVGLQFSADGQLARNLNNATPEPAIGRTRRANRMSILTSEAHEDLKLGTTASNLEPALLSSDGYGTPELVLADDQPFTGVLVQPINDDVGLDAQAIWNSVGPYRLTVALVSVFQGSEG